MTANPNELACGCDALVLVTDWQAFRELDYSKLAEVMATPVIIDGRNFLNPDELAQAGFTCINIGRPTTTAPVAPTQNTATARSKTAKSAIVQIGTAR